MERKALAQAVDQTIRCIADFPKPGILFRDITPVLQTGELFGAVCAHFAGLATAAHCTAVAGIESRGFVFAAPVAAMLGLPLVLIRKPGKLPFRTRKASYALEYGTDQVEMHEDALRKGDRVAIIDDLLATGGTMEAAVRLARDSGADIGLVACLIELQGLQGRAKLPGLPVDVLLSYPGT